MDAEDAAVAGREDRERQGKDVDPEAGGLPSLFWPTRTVVELQVAGELGRVGFVVAIRRLVGQASRLRSPSIGDLG
jgi:hypothetical protein